MPPGSRGVFLVRGYSAVGCKMACKACASVNVQKLAGELSASFPDLEAAKVPPIYVCQDLTVCLDCGFAELVIPADTLEQLNKRNAASA